MITTERAQPQRESALITVEADGSLRSRARRERLRRKLRSEGVLVFLSVAFCYVVVGVLLDFKYDLVTGDAASRMANAFYVLYSRDPHIGAIGFVWNPLPSIIDMFFLLFKDIWGALAARNMAGSLMSAFSMAGAVYQCERILNDWRVRPQLRIVILAAIALNPMVILYAGNGMSEALYMFTLIATTRYLLRWVRRDHELRSLIYAAIFLGLGYLARNEVVGSTALAGTLVIVLSFVRAKGSARGDRILSALTDATIFLAPVTVAIVGWAVASYVITGQAFAQFQSQYGNSSQIKVNLGHSTITSRANQEFHQLFAMAPEIALVLLVVLVVFLFRRDVELLVPVAVLGGSLGFSIVGYLMGSVFPWFRFFILAVPLCALLIAGLLGRPNRMPSGGPRWAIRQRYLNLLVVLVAAVILLPSIVTTGRGMFNPKIGSEEAPSIGYIFHRHLDQTDIQAKDTYGAIDELSKYFTGLHLKDGDVIVDTFDGCVPQLYTTIANPKIFVITNDRDFQKLLADPLRFGAHYILVPSPVGLGALDATNTAYPTLYATGAGFAKLQHQINGVGQCPTLRLYRIERDFIGV